MRPKVALHLQAKDMKLLSFCTQASMTANIFVFETSYAWACLFQDESTLIWFSDKEEKHLKLSRVSRIISGQRTVSFLLNNIYHYAALIYLKLICLVQT